MKTATWFKDVLLISIGLSTLAGLAAFLLSSDRVRDPESFHSNQKSKSEIANVGSRVDTVFARQHQELGIGAAPRASSLKIARRLALALAGTVPSVEEIRRLEEIEPSKQIDWYVSRLLEDKRTSSFLAERFARQFVGTDEGPFLIFRRRRFASWMSKQLEEQRPYDDIARQLLLDSGLWTDAPAVNFYTYNILPDEDEVRPDAIKLAARTSRAFLGMRIDCLQCHDDFLGTMNLGSAENPEGGTQLHFHQLASFFSQVENSLMGIRDNLKSETYQYKLLDDDDASKIEPEVPFNSHLDGDEKNQRLRLANWVTHPENRPFARAFVNRIWAIMFGRGLIHPIDNIPLNDDVSEAMEILADDFVENGFDIRRLLRIIAVTNTFQRDSDFHSTSTEISDLHKDSWAVFPLSRLRPDQVAGAIIQSTSLTTVDSTSHIVERLVKFGQQNEFILRYGDPGEEEFNERGETVTQKLLMMNGKLVAERLNDGINSPSRLRGLSPDVSTAVETVYLAVLSRRPTPSETDYFESQMIDATRSEQRQKTTDLFWTLINSIEFSWNH